MKPVLGQALVEYAVFIAVVIAALIGAQFYVKRGLMGRFRQAQTSIGDEYVPGRTDADQTTTLTRRETETFTATDNPDKPGFKQFTNSSETAQDETKRSGFEEVHDEPSRKLFDP